MKEQLASLKQSRLSQTLYSSLQVQVKTASQKREQLVSHKHFRLSQTSHSSLQVWAGTASEKKEQPASLKHSQLSQNSHTSVQVQNQTASEMKEQLASLRHSETSHSSLYGQWGSRFKNNKNSKSDSYQIRYQYMDMIAKKLLLDLCVDFSSVMLLSYSCL